MDQQRPSVRTDHAMSRGDTWMIDQKLGDGTGRAYVAECTGHPAAGGDPSFGDVADAFTEGICEGRLHAALDDDRPTKPF